MEGLCFLCQTLVLDSEIKRSRRLQREEVCGFFMKYDFSLSVQRLLFAFLQEGKSLFQAFVCHEEMLHE